MSKTNTFETAILELIFNNTALANIGDSSGLQPSAANGSLWVGLFTGDTGETGVQTDEANYTGYARVQVDRVTSGWTVSSGVTSNTAAVTFPACTGGSNTVSHFAILTAATAGDLLYGGALTAPLSVSSGITPEMAIGALTVTED